MAVLTNIQAVQCEMKPYGSDSDELELLKALMQASDRTGAELDPEGQYEPRNEQTIALAAVIALSRYITLSGENEGNWSQSYNDKLSKRIISLCTANGLKAEEFLPYELSTVRDGSKYF